MKKLFVIALLFVTFQSYGQMTKEDVTNIIDEIWTGATVETIIIEHNAQNTFTLRGDGNTIQKEIKDGYMKLKDSSGDLFYLPFDKIKMILMSSNNRLIFYMAY